MNSTLLIHEATMADEEIELAKAKDHSTIREAISIGKQSVTFTVEHFKS